MGQAVAMSGALIMIFVLVVVIPVGVLLSGMVAAAILGTILKMDGESNASSPELVDINR
jgi:hypothetical protein